MTNFEQIKELVKIVFPDGNIPDEIREIIEQGEKVLAKTEKLDAVKDRLGEFMEAPEFSQYGIINKARVVSAVSMGRVLEPYFGEGPAIEAYLKGTVGRDTHDFLRGVVVGLSFMPEVMASDLDVIKEQNGKPDQVSLLKMMDHAVNLAYRFMTVIHEELVADNG